MLVENVFLLEGHHMPLIQRLANFYWLKSKSASTNPEEVKGLLSIKMNQEIYSLFTKSDKLSSILIQSPGNIDSYTLKSLLGWRV